MSNSKKVAAGASVSSASSGTSGTSMTAENRARQVALGFALSFASFVLLTQFVRAFFG